MKEVFIESTLENIIIVKKDFLEVKALFCNRNITEMVIHSLGERERDRRVQDQHT